MTARSKVTLVEAQQIRAKILKTVDTAIPSATYGDELSVTVDTLMALGLIDTDAALRLVAADE